VSIVVLDSGVNRFHPDLAHRDGSTEGPIVVNESFVPGETYIDGDGHGTFIGGMLAGNGESSSGSISGLVPGSDIWNVKVLNSTGSGEDTWTESALDWIDGLVAKPDVMSISFGATVSLPGIESRLKKLWNDGVFIVIAAGNEGLEYYMINSPGNVLDVMTVGACTTDGYLLTFSSEGPTSGDYYYKPDIVAFGSGITSLGLHSGYVDGSGTSFAVPFISAGVALLIEATGGTKSPDEIKAAIINSCTPLGYPNFMEGAGLPNFTRALQILQDPSWNGFAVLPGDIEFPIKSKNEGTIRVNQ
jgi:serine protease AprX